MKVVSLSRSPPGGAAASVVAESVEVSDAGPGIPESAREQLFDAFLTELCEPGPLPVVVIEDVHWADEATLDLLGFLIVAYCLFARQIPGDIRQVHQAIDVAR